MAVYQEFTIDQGSDATIELHLVDKNGTAKNLTGYTVTARLKKNYSDSAGEATAFTSVVTNTTGGIATLSLSNTQTDALKAGRHVYDVLLTRPGGDKLIGVEGTALVRPGISTGFFS